MLVNNLGMLLCGSCHENLGWGMDRCQRCSPHENIIAFQFWFRIVTIILVAIFALTGVKKVYIIPLVAAIFYNIAAVAFKLQVIDRARKYPAILGIDLMISFLLLATSGGYKSPYYLYSYSPLVLGAFLFGYRGAFLTAGLQSALYFLAISVNGYPLSRILSSGETIVTDFFFFFLASLSVAYLSDLMNKLDSANERKAVVEQNLQEAKRRLAESLKLHQLSARETQVFILTSEGLTADRIAQELGVSKNTVKTHLCRSYKKLGVSTKQEAIVKAIGQESTCS